MEYEMMVELIEKAIKLLGEPFDSKELTKDTAKRIVNVWIEMSEGIRQPPPQLKWFRTQSTGLLIKGPIMCYSLCPHHFLPIELRVLVGFFPNGYTLGISKITRTVFWACKKFALQEDITKIIADTIWNVPENYKPKGVIVGTIGVHLCEKIRGIRSPSLTTVIESRGSIKGNILKYFEKYLHEGYINENKKDRRNKVLEGITGERR